MSSHNTDKDMVRFHNFEKIVWQKLKEKGQTIPQIEKQRNVKLPVDSNQESFRNKPIWHNKREIDDYVAKKLNLNPKQLGNDKSKNYFYKKLVNEISRLRKEGKIIDLKQDKRTGIWRIDN